MQTLENKHNQEIKKKENKVSILENTLKDLRLKLQESNELYYKMYLEKCIFVM